MKRAIAILVLVGAAVIALASVPLRPDVENTLTAIDQVPTKEQINNAIAPDDPLTKLTEIATDTDPTPDAVSIRLRAIHALAKYCNPTPCVANDPAHQTITAVLNMTRGLGGVGTDVLILRASIETLGAMKVASDVGALQDLLNHASRDIRAATARSLRDLCNNQAVIPLTQRLSVEKVPQVKLAISEALRILSQCGQ